MGFEPTHPEDKRLVNSRLRPLSHDSLQIQWQNLLNTNLQNKVVTKQNIKMYYHLQGYRMKVYNNKNKILIFIKYNHV